MESNWRFDVWRFGLTTVPVDLAARMHTTPGTSAALCRYTGPLTNVAVVAILDAGDYAFLLQFIPVTPGASFPYGIAVFPD